MNICNLPPTETEPPIPTPPETVKAPEDIDVEAVAAVVANPETLNISVDGL